MSLWWLQPGWTATTCARCGDTIWPAGDPDWGLCVRCFDAEHSPPPEPYPSPRCDICGTGEACASVGPYAVCSQECHHAAARRSSRTDVTQREAAALLAAMNASEDVAAPPAIEYHEAARPGAETPGTGLDPNPVRED